MAAVKVVYGGHVRFNGGLSEEIANAYLAMIDVTNGT
jgi:hypothetical protein